MKNPHISDDIKIVDPMANDPNVAKVINCAILVEGIENWIQGLLSITNDPDAPTMLFEDSKTGARFYVRRAE